MFKVLSSVSKVSVPSAQLSTQTRQMGYKKPHDKAISTVQWKTKIGRKSDNPNNSGPLVDLPDFHFLGKFLWLSI